MTSSSPGKPGSLAPNVAAVLAYVGGAVTGIIMLIVEKRDRFVRFHAMQSTMTFLGVLVAHLMLKGLPLIGPLLYVPFVIGVVILWVALMVRAFNGETWKLPYIGAFAEHQLK